jgi:hypothetical protein
MGLDPEKCDLSSKGPLIKKILLFSVLLDNTENIPGVLSLKINFSSTIDQPYSIQGNHCRISE